MSNNNKVFSLGDLTSVLNDERRAELLEALKDKLHNMPDFDILEGLTPAVRKRVEVLQKIQGEHDELEKKCLEEIAAIEAKYQILYKPLYTKRYEIVNGIAQMELVGDETAAADSDETGVPSFWLIALKNNEILAGGINENDEEALKYLKDITWTRIEDPKGFKLEFFFDTNPYFTNSVLTKTYHVVEDDDEPLLDKAIGTKIDWLPGKNLIDQIFKKKVKKGSKNGKQITKTETSESFFNFFYPPEFPEDIDDIDEERAEELQAVMDVDYEIGLTIRDKIIPHAVSWFTGEAAEGYYDDDDDEDDSDFMEEEDDDSDENDSDVKIKDGGAMELGEGSSQGERPAECKQQ